ncbi:hypothetical protein EWM64_g6559 [Hericium alpestre]|uniref:Uncharacterized protein n=1 Tax=Hericium alpestre TaxID=135208 RepID=A0A4Y9ZSA6_9AGAM|nr:hypothetical protein EWM64_g6559 [Hericium alpestre]
MAPPLNRQALESMKRLDLQRLCKDHGLKANLKTEALIDLLLDSNEPVFKPQPPQPVPSQRSVSSRIVSRASSSRSRLHSTSSMIIHSDSEDEDRPVESQAEPAPPAAPEPGPATRTRKAKEAQLKLGVGRPVVAGGAGARAVTRGASSGRGRRAKSSRSVKPVEETIQEEPEPNAQTSSPALPEPTTETQKAAPSPPSHINVIDTVTVKPPSPIQLDQVQATVQAQIQPLHQRVSCLQNELQQLTSTHAREVGGLQSRIQTLETEVQDYRRQAETIMLLRVSLERLETEFGRVLRSRSAEPMAHEPMNLSTPISIPSGSPPQVAISSLPAGDRTSLQPSAPTAFLGNARSSRHSPATFEQPSVQSRSNPATDGSGALGKRRRGSDASSITGTVEVGKEGDMTQEELNKVVMRPGKKRAKLQDATDGSQPLVAGPSGPATAQGTTSRSPIAVEAGGMPPVRPTFSVFEGPEELSRIYPRTIAPVFIDEITEDDFAFFDSATNPSARSSGTGPKTSTAHATENQRPFSFTFPLSSSFPMTSTPAASGSMPTQDRSPISNNFPYPEPPHSPSPAPTQALYGHRVDRGGRIERNDPFHPFGTPPGSRNPSGSTATTLDSGINPNLLGTPPSLADMLDFDHDQGAGIRRKASSNDVGHGLGMTSMRAEDTPAGPMRRTMYGTELEADTRFGDFGVEGVATGFWGR